MRHADLFLREFGDDWVGVKCCSHTLLLHAWVSVRRARSHPEPAQQKNSPQGASVWLCARPYRIWILLFMAGECASRESPTRPPVADLAVFAVDPDGFGKHT